MEKLLAKLRHDFPTLQFEEGAVASWSPRHNRVSYCTTDPDAAVCSLLHELGHALRNHQDYSSDISLVRKESEAWDSARDLATKYQINIDDNHVQECMDTYRDWLYKRSTCPDCGAHGLQQSKALYCCSNCQSTWMVSSARFCRPYRLKKAQTA